MTAHPDAPDGYDRALTDPAFLARFAAAYRGRHEPLDVLFWQQHPGSSAPSGAEDPAAALRRARVAVYRAGASDDDRRLVAELASAAEQERAAGAAALAVAAPTPGAQERDPDDRHETGAVADPAGSRSSRMRAVPIGAGALAAAAALVVAGVLASGPEPASRRSLAPAPLVVAQPIVYFASLPSAGRARADLAVLVENPPATGLNRFLNEHLSGVSDLLAHSTAVGGGTTVGPLSFSLAGLLNPEPARPVTVLLSCSRATPYSWTLSIRGAKPLRVHGSECHGQVVATQVLLDPQHPATVLHIDVPGDVRALIEFDVPAR